MAQGIRQPIHSIASLAVPIETDGNASAAGGHKGKGGGDGVVRRRRARLKKTQRGDREESERGGRRGGRAEGRLGGIARRVNSALTLSGRAPVNRLLSAAAERLHTEPWKHRGMDQLCPKPRTTADKGCTEAGDQLSFAQTGFRLPENASGRSMGNNFCSCMHKKFVHSVFFFFWKYTSSIRTHSHCASA